MRLSFPAEYRILHLLERAGARGLTVRELTAQYWGGRMTHPKARAVAGQMVCQLVNVGYASRMGREENAIHVLQADGRARLAEIARDQAEQARTAAEEARRREGEDNGPWF
jgi:hypothetical protein